MNKTTCQILLVVFVLFTLSASSFAYYSHQTGRFIQRDPIGIRDGICIIEFTPTGSPTFPRSLNTQEQYRDGMNLYLYCRAKPLSLQDSLGLWCGITLRQAEKRLKGDDVSYGHAWIQGCGSSFGWWPKSVIEDDEGVGSWELLNGTPGLLAIPDPYGGEIPDKVWGTGNRRRGKMWYGRKAGTSCKCVHDCADVCSCIRSLALRTAGTWGLTDYNETVTPQRREWGSMVRFHGVCTDWASYAMWACCLYAFD